MTKLLKIPVTGLRFFLILTLLLSLSTCKRKTTIKVNAYNYALAEPISNASIVLVEKKDATAGGTSCKVIAEATTDANGECSFEKEKLKIDKKFSYFMAISTAYGKDQSYSCGGNSANYLEVGNTNTKELQSSDFVAYFKVQYTNLLNPSISGDSLVIAVTSPKYTVPSQPYPFGGGGLFGAWPNHEGSQYPFPNLIITETIKTTGGKNILYVRKRKMGVTTSTIDTIKIYPYETKTIEIKW